MNAIQRSYDWVLPRVSKLVEKVLGKVYTITWDFMEKRFIGEKLARVQ